MDILNVRHMGTMLPERQSLGQVHAVPNDPGTDDGCVVW